MKKIFKKNQIIVTALALVIAAAGYLSYSNTELQTTMKNTVKDKITDIAQNEKQENDAEQLAVNTEVIAEEESELPDEDVNPGEAVLTGTDAGIVDFAAEAKLSREQMRSKNKETLMEIINSQEIDEASKQDAIQQMVQMTEIAEKEEAAEMLLEAKGFTEVVVSITENAADVVLNMGEDVTDAKRAQVEDIVKRKTGVAPENIVITPIQ